MRGIAYDLPMKTEKETKLPEGTRLLISDHLDGLDMPCTGLLGIVVAMQIYSLKYPQIQRVKAIHCPTCGSQKARPLVAKEQYKPE